MSELYARTSDGKEYTASAARQISNWTQIKVAGIAVADGKLEIGIRTETVAKNWMRVDDVVLVKEGTSAVKTASRSDVRKKPSLLLGTETFRLASGETMEVYELSGKRRGIVVGDGSPKTLREAGFGNGSHLVRLPD